MVLAQRRMYQSWEHPLGHQDKSLVHHLQQQVLRLLLYLKLELNPEIQYLRIKSRQLKIKTFTIMKSIVTY